MARANKMLQFEKLEPLHQRYQQRHKVDSRNMASGRNYVPVNSKTAHLPPPGEKPLALDFFNKFWDVSKTKTQKRGPKT